MGHLGRARERLKANRARITGATQCGTAIPNVVDVAELPYVPTDEDKKLLADHTTEVRKRQVSSSENFDKSVLTLSSGGLAVSLGFLKDFIPIGQANAAWTLYASWALLTTATVITMLSFLASMKAQEFQQQVAEGYYLRKEDPAARLNPWDRMVIWMNRVSGASFIFGVILTTLFVAINLQKAQEMKNSRTITHDGLTSPAIQQTSNSLERRGLPSPAIVPSAPARPAQPPAPAPAPQTK